MKRLIVLLCALYLVLFYGTAFAASTSKVSTTTLNDIPPAWSKTLQCDTTVCPRFELVMAGAAVLDHETGLVWLQSPIQVPAIWTHALEACTIWEVGGRKGWHLPTIEQLASLIDTSVAGPPYLPAGHPFTIGETAFDIHHWFWSATSYPTLTTRAWGVLFFNGSISGFDKNSGTIDNFGIFWCVRGGQSFDDPSLPVY